MTSWFGDKISGPRWPICSLELPTATAPSECISDVHYQSQTSAFFQDKEPLFTKCLKPLSSTDTATYFFRCDLMRLQVEGYPLTLAHHQCTLKFLNARVARVVGGPGPLFMCINNQTKDPLGDRKRISELQSRILLYGGPQSACCIYLRV
jgi:hypothetical protein